MLDVTRVVGSGMTRARLLRLCGGALALGPLAAACGGPAPGSSDTAPSSPAKRPVTLIIDNDWSEGDRYKLVQAWLDIVKRKYPHITTQLHDNAASHEKTHSIFA